MDRKVFFDRDYNSLIDLHSYGHDIETSWLVDRAVETVDDPDIEWRDKIHGITGDLSQNILNTAFDGHSLPNECENGKVDEKRIWWVQA